MCTCTRFCKFVRVPPAYHVEDARRCTLGKYRSRPARAAQPAESPFATRKPRKIRPTDRVGSKATGRPRMSLQSCTVSEPLATYNWRYVVSKPRPEAAHLTATHRAHPSGRAAETSVKNPPRPLAGEGLGARVACPRKRRSIDSLSSSPHPCLARLPLAVCGGIVRPDLQPC